jgi:cystathionine beta-lyase/cystathionine gamma-synthase
MVVVMTWAWTDTFQSVCCNDALLDEQRISSHVPPIYATSTFIYPWPEEAIRFFEEVKECTYLDNRWGIPNSALVEAKIAAREACGVADANGPLELEAVLSSSGAAAISALFLSLGLRCDAAVRVMKNVRRCTLTATLGAMDSLIQHPASMTHVKVPRAQHECHGITDGLLRLSVGIEGVGDVIADLDHALQASVEGTA